MLTKALAVLVAPGPRRADSCKINEHWDNNMVNCTIVKKSTNQRTYLPGRQ